METYKPLRGDFQKLVGPTQSGPSTAAVVHTVPSCATAGDCLCSTNSRFTAPVFEWRVICSACHGTIATRRRQNVQHVCFVQSAYFHLHYFAPHKLLSCVSLMVNLTYFFIFAMYKLEGSETVHLCALQAVLEDVNISKFCKQYTYHCMPLLFFYTPIQNWSILIFKTVE